MIPERPPKNKILDLVYMRMDCTSARDPLEVLNIAILGTVHRSAKPIS